MTEYIDKAELMEQYPEFDGLTFADVTTIDIVHCKECIHEDMGMCSHIDHEWERHEADYFCADGERR